MGNGGEDGKGMQVNDDDIHCQFCLSPMQFQGQVNFISCNCLNQAQQVKEEAVGGEGGIEAEKAKEVSPKENPTTG